MIGWILAGLGALYFVTTRPAAAGASPTSTGNPLARLFGASRPTTIRTAPLAPLPAGRSDFQTAQLAARTAAAGAGAVASYGADVAADAQFLGGVFSLITGGGAPVLTHVQRETREVAKVGGVVQTMITELGQAQTLDQLWATLVKWQSGYVGGTSSVAVGVGITIAETRAHALAGIWSQAGTDPKFLELVTRGDVTIPVGMSLAAATAGRGTAVGIGNPNPYYNVFTRDGFFRYLQENPAGFYVGVQAGVTPSALDPVNQAVMNAILNQLDTLGWGT